MKKLGLLLLLAALLFLTACGGGSSVGPIDEQLVGTWQWSSDIEWEYVLESDGTGTRNGEVITWTAEEGVFTLVNEAETELSRPYQIDGNVLIIESGANTFHYVNPAIDPVFAQSHALVGVWQNQGNSEDIFIFEAGGTGTMGSAAEEMIWWLTPENDILLLDRGAHAVTLVLDYEVNGEEVVFSFRTSDNEFTFIWLGEDWDSIVFPTEMLEDIEYGVRLARYVQNLQFAEIVTMVDTYLTRVSATEEDSAHEIRELAVRAAELLEGLYVYVDSFDNRITVYYPGVRAISNNINVVPYIRPSGRGSVSQTRPRASANLHIDFGFYRSGWLFFDRASLRMSNDTIWENNFGAFDTNRDVIRGGTIREVGPRDWGLVNGISVTGRLVNHLDVEYDHVLRFINRGDDTHFDVSLSEDEILALATIGELYRIMAQLGFDILQDHFR